MQNLGLCKAIGLKHLLLASDRVRYDDRSLILRHYSLSIAAVRFPFLVGGPMYPAIMTPNI